MPFPGIYPPPISCQSTAAAIEADLRAAEQAFAAAPPDLNAFYAASASARGALGCLTEPLPKASTARLYEVLALLSYAEKDLDDTAAFLAGARQLGGGLPTEILGRTPRLAELSQGSPSNAGAVPLTPPAGVRLWVDGAEAEARPADRPYLLQVRWEDGRVHWTGLMAAGAAPELTRLAPLPARVAPTCPDCPTCENKDAPGTPEKVKPPPAWLTVSALGSTLAAAGLYGLGVQTMHSYYTQPHSEDEETALQQRSAALTWAAGGVGVAALGLDTAWGIVLARRF